jgi:hypothetical protein
MYRRPFVATRIYLFGQDHYALSAHVTVPKPPTKSKTGYWIPGTVRGACLSTSILIRRGTMYVEVRMPTYISILSCRLSVMQLSAGPLLDL